MLTMYTTKADKIRCNEASSNDLRERQRAWDNERENLEAKIRKLEVRKIANFDGDNSTMEIIY